MTVKQYEENDLQAMITIWNDVVEDGQIVGLYILPPNNVGRCGHLCNASYAVDAWKRGLHIGEKLVRTVLYRQKESDFRCCSLMR